MCRSGDRRYRMKILLFQTNDASPETLALARERERQDVVPMSTTFNDRLNVAPIDLRVLRRAPALRRCLYALVPTYVSLAIEAFLLRNEYDVAVTWMEKHSIIFALLQLFTRKRIPHVALMYWMSKPDVRFLLSLVHPAIDKIVTWSSVQQDFAIDQMKIPARKVRLVKHFVDAAFWRPLPDSVVDGETAICSAGAEMRDYPTLIEAMRDLPIVCHIAAREVRAVRRIRAKRLSIEEFKATLPPNVTIRGYAPVELRELYRRSRLVVIPLLPSKTDNGITVILEAMAMGKTVICSRTEGQKDAIEDGVTGVLVEPGNADALRKTIVRLLDSPEEVRRIGDNARRYILASRHPLERFTQDVAAAVAETVGDSSK